MRLEIAGLRVLEAAYGGLAEEDSDQPRGRDHLHGVRVRRLGQARGELIGDRGQPQVGLLVEEL